MNGDLGRKAIILLFAEVGGSESCLGSPLFLLLLCSFIIFWGEEFTCASIPESKEPFIVMEVVEVLESSKHPTGQQLR